MKKKVLLVGMLAVSAFLAVALGGCLLFNSAPTADFSWSPSAPFAGSDIQFDASSSTDSDGTIASYDWDFGDGSSGSGQVINHQFADNGIYSVQLTVTDDKGAVSCVTKSITVLNPAPKFGLKVRNLDSPSCCHNYTCNRIEVDLENVVDPAGLAPKTVVSTIIDFGDGPGSVFSGRSAIYRYTRPGTYTITATVTDDDGAKTVKTQQITIESCPLVPPVVRLIPRPSSVELGTVIRFHVQSYDPDELCEGCTPCPPPCPPTCPPCQSEKAEPSAAFDESLFAKLSSQSADNETSGIVPVPCPDCGGYSGAGIVRIQVNVENPCGDVRVLEGVTNFSVEFDIPGTWIIRGIVWDDDCGCSHSATFTHEVEAYIP